MADINKNVQDYYGKTLQKSEDLKTNACCTLDAPPTHIQTALAKVHADVQAKYYGCGLTIPNQLTGLRILDLGSGSGRDCYIAAQLVGESGFVTGIDMTKEQLAVANEYLEYHRNSFGYKKSNVEFVEGNIEQLDKLNLTAASYDLVISNCVINLAQDKAKVLKDTFDLLKDGGELFFSDVYADRRISKELQEDQVLWGECLSGALYWRDFEHFAKQAGFDVARIVETKPITVQNAELEKKLGDIKFFSLTYRLIKSEGMDQFDEDYGLQVTYNGTITESGQSLLWDQNFTFTKDEKKAVDRNTFYMLKNSRYAKHFSFHSCCSSHQGPFEFDKAGPDEKIVSQGSGCC